MSLLDSGLNAELLTFPPGEAHKNRDRWAILSDELLKAGFGRDSAVVAIGGGVTGDLAGFVAATFMRGIPVVHVPTTLVAMVDSSVGGKTGVDTPAGKNLIGAFHPPAMVVIDPLFARTLPRGRRAEGLVEALKHGAILDERYYLDVGWAADALLDGDPEATFEVVLGSVRVKAGVVSQDEREEGYRKILNFGHTVGHALEAASGFEVSHGAAVGWGMVLEAALGERLGITEEGTADALRESMRSLGFGDAPPPGATAGEIISHLPTDKKGRVGKPRYVLLKEIGSVAPGTDWSHEVPGAVAREVIEGEFP